MSTNVERPAGVVVLPPSPKPSEGVNPSMTRWVCNLYYPVNNMGHLSLARHFGFRGDHRYDRFERCVFYPLGDIQWQEVDRERIAEKHLAGVASTGPIPYNTHTKFAYEQAAEIAESFADRGFVVLQPGIHPDPTWVNDHELVTLIAETIMPRPFKLHEAARELGQGARARIGAAKDLTKDGKVLAERVRTALAKGAEVARREAEREHRELIRSMGEAAVGRPGIATPNEFHEWVCDQLGQPVPANVHTGKNQNATAIERGVEYLIDKERRREEENSRMSELEARLAAVESKGKRQKAEKEEAEAAA